jgi:fibrillarin-like rRNA methylase
MMHWEKLIKDINENRLPKGYIRLSKDNKILEANVDPFFNDVLEKGKEVVLIPYSNRFYKENGTVIISINHVIGVKK